MKKTAAQKIISKIADNRKDSLIKQAYEHGVYTHALLAGCDKKTSKVIAKKASDYMTRSLEASENRKAAIKEAILAHLR